MKITKSQLKRLIKEEMIKEFNEQDNNEQNRENEESKQKLIDEKQKSFYNGPEPIHGWNEDAFKNKNYNIMEVLNEIERAILEINKGSRGVYANIGDTAIDFLENISTLGINLDSRCQAAINYIYDDYDD